MPRFREYQSQISEPTPSPGRMATAEDFGASGGVALTNFGAAVEGLSDHLEKAFVTSSINNALSKAQNELRDYSGFLEKGSVDENGVITPAPDPLQRAKLFDEKAKEVQQRIAEEHGELGKDFRERYDGLVSDQRLAVKLNTLDYFKQGVKSNIQVSLFNLANDYAKASDMEKERIRNNAGQTIQAGVTAGAMTPEEGKNQFQTFYKQNDESKLFDYLRLAPADGLKELEDGTKFRFINPEEKGKWMEKFQNKINHPLQSPEDKQFYSRLVLAAASGKDVSAKAQQGYIDGRVPKEGFDHVVSLVEAKGPRKEVENYMNMAMKTGQADSPFKPQIQSQVYKGFNDWLQAHPGAEKDRGLMYEEASALIKDASIVNFDEIQIANLPPRTLKGVTGGNLMNLKDEDFKAATKEINRRFESKDKKEHFDIFRRNEESSRLLRYYSAWQAQKTAQEMAEKTKRPK